MTHHLLYILKNGFHCNLIDENENTKMKKLTILTYPLNDTKYASTGHPCVTRSLIAGLTEIGYDDFNFNPSKEDVGEHIHVLFGPGPCHTLQYALSLKKQGLIKRVTAGPNVFVFPFESDFLITDPDLDLYMVPSYWIKTLFETIVPQCCNKLCVWPSGISKDLIDIERFPKKKAIIYKKNRSGLPDSFYDEIKLEIEKGGYIPILIKYGNYEYDYYINALKESSFMVAVTDQEAQGIFLSEAWALDVPTLCYEQGYYTWKNALGGEDLTYYATSACPYLTSETGVKFSNLDEFRQLIKHIDFIINQTSPRNWILNNMTDEISARNFLDILQL